MNAEQMPEGGPRDSEKMGHEKRKKKRVRKRKKERKGKERKREREKKRKRDRNGKEIKRSGREKKLCWHRGQRGHLVFQHHEFESILPNC